MRINKLAGRISFHAIKKVEEASSSAIRAFREAVGDLQNSVEILYPGDTIGLNINMIPEIQNAIRAYCENLYEHLNVLDVHVSTNEAFKGVYAREVTEFLKCVKACCEVMIGTLQVFSRQLEEIGTVMEEKDKTISGAVSNQAAEIMSVAKEESKAVEETKREPISDSSASVSQEAQLSKADGQVEEVLETEETTSGYAEISSEVVPIEVVAEEPVIESVPESQVEPSPNEGAVVEETPEVLALEGEESAPVASEVVPTSSVGGVDVSIYHDNPNAGFTVSTGNQTYSLSDSDFDLLCAVVSAESDHSYDDSLAVISTILNRCETPNWVASFGTNPIGQITGKGQFSAYLNGSYKKYTSGNAPEKIQTAVRDALNGVRNHGYLGFRSNGSSGYSSNMITSSGNRYK